MKRRVFTILSALSVLLCIATGTIWVRSYWLHEGVCWEIRSGTHGWAIALHWEQGTATVAAANTDEADKVGRRNTVVWLQSPVGSFENLSVMEPWEARRWLVWYGYDDGAPSANETWRAFGIPCWLVMLATAVTPALWPRRPWRRRCRMRHGLCLICGYDLRASPQRCPECGTAIAEPRDIGTGAH